MWILSQLTLAFITFALSYRCPGIGDDVGESLLFHLRVLSLGPQDSVYDPSIGANASWIYIVLELPIEMESLSPVVAALPNNII